MRYPCLFCLTSEAVEVKLDRKSRPYSTCRSCGTRAFMHTRQALRGMKLLAPQIAQLWAAGAADATVALRQADRAVDAAIEADELPASGVR